MGSIPGHQPQKLKAFTLLEVLVTLAVLSLAMFLISGLATQYLRVASESTKRNQGSLVVRALQSVLDEAGSAVEVSLPIAVNQSSATLVFRKFDPLATRFPTPAPTPFIPVEDRNLVRVRYFLDQGVLMRTVQAAPPSPPGIPMAVLDGLAGFSVLRLSSREVEVSLSFQEAQGQLQIVRGRVYSWAEK